MEFMVDPGKVNEAAADMESCKKSVHTVWSTVERIRNNCAVQGKTRSSVMSSLREIMSDIERQENSIRNMSEALEEISSVYENTEQKVRSNLTSDAGKKPGKTNSNSSGKGDTGSGDDIRKWKWSWKDTWEVITEAGPVGTVIGMTGNLITGGVNTENVISAGKSITKIIGSGAEIVSSGTSTGWWEKLIGWNAAAEPSKDVGKIFAKKWTDSFVDDLGFNGAPKVSDKVKVGTKWAGHALTLAGNAVENYQEAHSGNISAGRAVAETIVETGADIVVGAAASAGATAVLTAASTALLGVAAPAVVVGAAAVGVTWVANQACESIFGKDIGEVAADVVCDAGEAVISGVKNVGKAVGKGLTKAANSVGDAFKSAGNAMKKIGTKWSKGIFAFA